MTPTEPGTPHSGPGLRGCPICGRINGHDHDADPETPQTAAGRRALALYRQGWSPDSADFILAIEAEARTPLLEAARAVVDAFPPSPGTPRGDAIEKLRAEVGS